LGRTLRIGIATRPAKRIVEEKKPKRDTGERPGRVSGAVTIETDLRTNRAAGAVRPGQIGTWSFRLCREKVRVAVEQAAGRLREASFFFSGSSNPKPKPKPKPKKRITPRLDLTSYCPYLYN
jgi:hypothetical protein